MNHVKTQGQNSTNCSDLALFYAVAGAPGRGLTPCHGGAPVPCQAPETNGTTAIHLVHKTEWAEVLQGNKVSAPWKRVLFGIVMNAYVLAWVFLQEGALGRYTLWSRCFHWQTSAYLNIRGQTVIAV